MSSGIPKKAPFFVSILCFVDYLCHICGSGYSGRSNSPIMEPKLWETFRERIKRVRVNLTRPSPDFRGICICNPGRASGAYSAYNKDLPACSAFVEIPIGFPVSICAITTKGNVFLNGTSVGREYRSCINGANENQNPIYVRAVFYVEIKERQDSLKINYKQNK